MLKVEKITEKVELLDLEVQDSNPCKYYWDNNYGPRKYDCMVDCYEGTSPYLTVNY